MDRRKINATFQDFFEVFAIVGDAAASAAHGEAWAQNDRVAHAFGEFQSVLEVVDELGLRHIKPNFLHGIFEEQAIFGLFDGFDFGTDQFDFVRRRG